MADLTAEEREELERIRDGRPSRFGGLVRYDLTLDGLIRWVDSGVAHPPFRPEITPAGLAALDDGEVSGG